MRASFPFLALLLALGSCGSPPKAPTVDESRKRPVNMAAAVELQACKSDLQNTRILAQETISSMQAGLVYGQIGQTEYIVNAVKKETGLPDMKVVATGGLGRIIADETDVIDIYDAALTMEGLRYIYEKNRR